MKQTIAILGSTGSIGKNLLEIISKNKKNCIHCHDSRPGTGPSLPALPLVGSHTEVAE